MWSYMKWWHSGTRSDLSDKMTSSTCTLVCCKEKLIQWQSKYSQLEACSSKTVQVLKWSYMTGWILLFSEFLTSNNFLIILLPALQPVSKQCCICCHIFLYCVHTTSEIQTGKRRNSQKRQKQGTVISWWVHVLITISWHNDYFRWTEMMTDLLNSLSAFGTGKIVFLLEFRF